MTRIERPRGTHDILPSEQPLWRKVTSEIDRLCSLYAYRPVQDPQGLTALRMHSELDRDSDRETVLARFVAQLNPDDEQVLRRLLEDGE